jgi:hypothetical protein
MPLPKLGSSRRSEFRAERGESRRRSNGAWPSTVARPLPRTEFPLHPSADRHGSAAAVRGIVTAVQVIEKFFEKSPSWYGTPRLLRLSSLRQTCRQRRLFSRGTQDQCCRKDINAAAARVGYRFGAEVKWGRIMRRLDRNFARSRTNLLQEGRSLANFGADRRWMAKKVIIKI